MSLQFEIKDNQFMSSPKWQVFPFETTMDIDSSVKHDIPLKGYDMALRAAVNNE